MLQICSPCQPHHAPTLHWQANPTLWTCQPAHAALTLQVSNLLLSKAVTWQGCNIANRTSNTASLGAESTKSTGQTTPTHWPKAAQLHLLQLQVLKAKQIWPLLPTCPCWICTEIQLQALIAKHPTSAKCCKSATPANLTKLQPCTVKQIQHFKLAACPCCKFPTCWLQHARVQHSKPSGWKQPRALSLARCCPATPICTGFQLSWK